ncbi:hypothetical protein O3M35_010667 [Rhynocoris fuscipes]|uniref:lysozyme n=1 Tax=Rhynocoris fuscipes TaxID=488301 RepID=A0AAW1D181_9HEMI
MQIQNLIILLLSVCLLVIGRRFDECSMARELLRQGFPRHEIADWLCLIEAESSFRTDAINYKNNDTSWDHGLFQINDRYWCGRYGVGGDCKVKCEDLRTDDITIASRCAKLIKRRQGFKAWTGWVNNCRGQQLRNHLDHCYRCRNEL